MADVHYRPVTLDDYQQVRDLFEAVGWTRLTAEESRLRRMIDNANRTVGAFDGERMVGFARALCDEAFNGYVSAVCVHLDYQRQGIGTELVTQIIEDSPEITWVLHADPELTDFYGRHGFVRSSLAMERERAR